MKEKISSYQLFTLFYLSLLSTVALLYPPNVSGPDGWMAGLIASSLNLIIVAVIYLINKKTHDKTILQLLDHHPILKISSSIIILFYLLILTSITLTDLRAPVALFLLPNTPVSVILISGCLIVFLAAKSGIEVIARMSEWLFPLVLSVIIFHMSILFSDIDFDQLSPVLETGVKPTLYGAYRTFDFISFIFFILFLGPYLNTANKLTLTSLQISGFTALTLFLQAIYVIGIIGSDLILNMPFGVMNTVRYAKLGLFFSSAEAPLLSIWLTTILVKLTLMTWLFTEILSSSFQLKERQAFVLPFLFLAVTLSFVMFPSSIQVSDFGGKIFTPFAISVQLLLPILLLPFLTKIKPSNK